jgi:hypothetical protein
MRTCSLEACCGGSACVQGAVMMVIGEVVRAGGGSALVCGGWR